MSICFKGFYRIIILVTLLIGLSYGSDEMQTYTEKVSLSPNSFYTTNFLLMKDAKYTVQINSDVKIDFKIFAHPKSDFKKSGSEGNLQCPGFYGHKTKTLARNNSLSKTLSGISAKQIGHFGVYVENRSKKKISFTIKHKVSTGKFIYTYHK